MTCFLASRAQSEYVVAHERVAMRTLGHELLLSVGDSTSRVLPVTYKDQRYIINFSRPFSIDPGVLAQLTDQIFKRSNLSENYIVELLDCINSTVHYSYEKSAASQELLVACTGRVLPENCYQIAILLGSNSVNTFLANQADSDLQETSESGLRNFLLTISFVLFAISIIGYFRVNVQKSTSTTECVMELGQFRFFEKEGKLTGLGREEELTGKEAELLVCLYASKNQTMDKSAILKHVWGDEGDYIGRTLDVYISRLRKKLEAEKSVKIQNIRGVGYRLVV